MMVDIKLIRKFKQPVTLKEIKENPKLQNMRLVQRGNRLSVMPVEKKEFDLIVKLSEK
ncbi:MAG: EVE domain-containing protein, partial [Melioribacteraceae bacterium]|nr:EVE domain-containing protein [Melioribacteraceae bacterium]